MSKIKTTEDLINFLIYVDPFEQQEIFIGDMDEELSKNIIDATRGEDCIMIKCSRF